MSFLDSNLTLTHPFLEACENAQTPFQLMYIGSLVSCFITILFVHAKCCGHCGKLIFWFVMFLLYMMQLYFDYQDLSSAMETFSQPGDLFNCYTLIVVNSPNFKWAVCSTLCSLSTAVFEKPDKSKKIQFSEAFNKRKLWKRFKKDPISEIFLICPFIITSLMTLPIFFTHILWGQIEYCWFTMVMLIASDICITVGKCLCRIKTKKDEDGNILKKTKCQLVLTVVFLLWQLGCYSMVYYIGAVMPANFVTLEGLVPLTDNYTMVFNETKTNTYIEAFFATVFSRNLTEYNNDMFFGENSTVFQKIEYIWVVI